MDILGRFLHLQVEEKTVPTGKGLKKLQSESMIFPRYHQLDVVRKLADHARQHRSGHNYLIQHTRHKIGGQAKAMVVTGSREHAVRYKLAFDNYLKVKKYHDIKTLVAFSGELSLDDHPGIRFTETQLNGSSSLKKRRLNSSKASLRASETSMDSFRRLSPIRTPDLKSSTPSGAICSRSCLGVQQKMSGLMTRCS
jgi:hypothetical protein